MENTENNIIVKVQSGDTLTGIAERLGITVGEILEANEIADPNMIEVGQDITIPAELVNVDTSGVGEAVDEAQSQAQEAADAATSEPITTEQEANIEIVAGDTTGGENLHTEATADVEVVAGETDASAAYASAQEETDSQFAETMTADGSVDAQLEKISDNIAEVYSGVGNELTSAFQSTFHVNGSVAVTLNWNITNPTASISTSISGGTATATISSATPHALGGIFTEPHLGLVAEAGPEAIIPLDGSQNAKNLWQEAGESLGFLQGDAPISVVPAKTSGSSSSDGEEKSVRRSVDININGNGRISASGGVSKEDVLSLLMEKAREVISNIIDEDILVEGEGAYEY